jgi:hypothetical protein
MMMNISAWLSYGIRQSSIILVLSFIFVCPGLPKANAKEFWNITGKSPELAATASADALDAVILGFNAFRRAETEGVEVRKNGLLLAADKLAGASKVMTEASAQWKNDPAFSTRLSFAEIPVEAKTDLDAWLVARKVDKLQTWGDFYQVGTKATADLATTYAGLAKRDDNAVFREFLNATYPYLKAGATASEIFASEVK